MVYKKNPASTVHGQVPARRYSMILNKLANEIVVSTMLVTYDETTEDDVYVKYNQADSVPIGMICYVDDRLTCGGYGQGLNRTQVPVTVLMEDLEDIVMYSTDDFVKGQVVYAGANGAVASTGTIPVGYAGSTSVTETGVDGVARKYFYFNSTFKFQQLGGALKSRPKSETANLGGK